MSPGQAATSSGGEYLVFAAIGLVCLGTMLIGAYGLRLSRTTSDFYVASRVVTPWWNASAIGGEYLSAASFLGVAGLVYAGGLDMLWFPLGYTFGFLVLLVLVAAPLRRSGAYTLPDFAEARMEHRGVRRLCSLFVVLIGWLYLLPQLHGAGIAITTLTGAPLWTGGLIVTLVVTTNVLAGGMRSITFVQAGQYWVKLIAIAIPAIVLLWIWVADGRPGTWILTEGLPQPLPMPEPSPAPLLTGQSEGMKAFGTVSTVLGLCLGTMGLPHVLVRYYTNPDGRAARRTTQVVIGLLGLFYLFPPVYGVLGRAYLPELPPEMRADTIVLNLPRIIAPGLVGDLLTALLAGGAFAAFLSTASGLTITIAGVLDQDLIRPRLSALTSNDAGDIHGFRIATLLSMAIPAALLPVAGNLGLAATVGLAFAVAASTFCPLLILGVWWRRLSVPGAAAGMIVGGVTSAGSAVATIGGWVTGDWLRVLVNSPAAWTIPLAFFVSMGVSLLTADRIPRGALRTMVRLHTPENANLLRTPR